MFDWFQREQREEVNGHQSSPSSFKFIVFKNVKIETFDFESTQPVLLCVLVMAFFFYFCVLSNLFTLGSSICYYTRASYFH